MDFRKLNELVESFSAMSSISNDVDKQSNNDGLVFTSALDVISEELFQKI